MYLDSLCIYIYICLSIFNTPFDSGAKREKLLATVLPEFGPCGAFGLRTNDVGVEVAGTAPIKTRWVRSGLSPPLSPRLPPFPVQRDIHPPAHSAFDTAHPQHIDLHTYVVYPSLAAYNKVVDLLVTCCSHMSSSATPLAPQVAEKPDRSGTPHRCLAHGTANQFLNNSLHADTKNPDTAQQSASAQSGGFDTSASEPGNRRFKPHIRAQS